MTAFSFRRAPTALTQTHGTQSATEQGLKITAINAYANDGVSSASYADDTGMARTIAEYMVEKLPENAQVVFFKGPDGNQAAMDRVVAYRTYLFEARPDVKILAEDFVEGWTKENALALMEDWIQNFDTIDGVISVNDTVASGRSRCAEERRLRYFERLLLRHRRFGGRLPVDSER